MSAKFVDIKIAPEVRLGMKIVSNYTLYCCIAIHDSF